MSDHGLRWHYIALAALRQVPTGLALPLFVLLPTARGLSPAQIGILLGAFSATTLVLELPTGGLADVVGPRPVLLIAAATASASALVVALAPSFGTLVIGFVLYGVARALDSGPLQSWFVTSVRSHDPAAPVRATLARAGALASAAVGLGAVATAAVTATAPLPSSGAAVLASSLPLLGAAAVLVLYGLLVAWWVRTPSRAARVSPRDVLADVPRTLRTGFGLSAARGPLRRLLAFTAALGAALAGVELLTPLHLTSVVADPADAAPAFAVLAAAAFAVAALGSAAAPLLARVLRTPQAAVAVSALVAAAALAGIGMPSPLAAAGSYLVFYALLGVGDPLVDELTHDAVESSHRTTVLSMRSMALQTVGLVTSVGLGWLSDRAGTALSFVVVAGALALGPCAFIGWNRMSAGSRAPQTEAASAAQAPVASSSGT